MNILRNKIFISSVILVIVACTCLAIGIYSLETTPVQAATDVYWVGDGGDWSDNTNHWSATSGGAPGAAKPTSADTVYFDANSFSSGSQTVTLDEDAYCLDIDWTGVTNTPTLGGAEDLYVYGSLTFDSSMACTVTGIFRFYGTGGGDTVDFSGVSLSSIIIFDGVGGDWTLQDGITTTNSLYLTNGTLDTNGQTLSTGNMVGQTAGTKTLTLGATTWTVDGYWNLTNTNTTLNCGTSTIILDDTDANFTGGTKTYYEVQFTGSGDAAILDGCQFTNLTRVGTASTTDELTLSADQTVTGTLTLTGNSVVNRLWCKSNAGSARTITSASNSVTDCDFQWINGAGAASWDFSANPGGCGYSGGGGTGITFSSPIYWVGGTSLPLGWSGTSGGTFSTHFDTKSDISGVFDANSPTSNNINCNGTHYIHDLTFSGVVNDMTFTTTGSSTLYVYGDVTLDSHAYLTFGSSQSLTWRIRGGTIQTLTTGGYSMGYSNIYTDSGSTLTLGSDLYTNGYVQFTLASWDTADYDVQCANISISAAPSIDLGSSTIYCSQWSMISATAFDAGTSTLSMTGSFTGAGKTYYDVALTSASAGELISGTNTFHDLTIIGAASSTAELQFQDDQSITNDFIVTGNNASTNRLYVHSDVSGTQRTIYVASGYAIQYCDVQDIVAAGATSPWDCSAGINVDLGNNLYISFTPATNCYWVGNGGNWSDASHWASSSGGSGGSVRVPIGNDSAIFDANSITLPLQTVTMNMPIVPTISALAIENNPTFSATTIYVRGSLSLGDLTFSVTNLYFQGADNHTLSSTNALSSIITINKDTSTMASITLTSNITVTSTIYLLSGTLKLSVFTLTAPKFDSYTTTYDRALDMDTGTFYLTSVSNKWYCNSTKLTVVDSPDSTIIFDSDLATACTFYGGNKGYGNFTIMGAGNYSTTISGDNSFNVITIDRSEANKTFTGSVTCTILGLSIPLEGTNTVTITNTDFVMVVGEVYGDYLIISGSDASGGGTFWANAGGHSTNNGGNTGWLWTLPDPPTVVTLDPSDVSFLGERLNGQITDLGDYSILYCYFEYGPTTSYGFETDPRDTLTGTGTFDFYLSPYKVYHYRAVAFFGLGLYEYGADKVISLTGAVGQAEADLSGLDFTEGTPLVDDAPDQPDNMYDEGSTDGIPIAPFVNPALIGADIPLGAFWYPIAFFIAILIGFLTYGWTRSFIFQPIASAMVMAAFCGGGVLGDGLLPYWTVLVFGIEAVFVFIIQERQTV